MTVAPDDAPIWVPSAARKVWANAYNDAQHWFNGARGVEGRGPRYRPGPIAMNVVRSLYNGGRRRRIRGSTRLPNPGNLVYLGGPLEVLYLADREGHIRRETFSHSACLWSHTLRSKGSPRSHGAVVAFRRRTIPVPRRSPYTAHRLVELHREWHAGKDPLGLSVLTVNKPKEISLRPAQVCVATLYRSDKFSFDGTSTDYVHVHTTPGVMAQVGPRAIIVRGGRMRLTEDGIAG